MFDSGVRVQKCRIYISNLSSSHSLNKSDLLAQQTASVAYYIKSDQKESVIGPHDVIGHYGIIGSFRAFQFVALDNKLFHYCNTHTNSVLLH